MRNGKIEFLYDAKFPALEEGATGEIVLDARLITSPQRRQLLTGDFPDSLELAPAGTLAALSISVRKCDRNLSKYPVPYAQARQLAGAPKATSERTMRPGTPATVIKF